MSDSPDSLVVALESCLSRMSAGEPAESCLCDFPAHADELAPMLVVYANLRCWDPPRLSAQVRAAAHVRARVALCQRYPQLPEGQM